MSDELDRDRIADLAREILDEVDGDDTQEPGELAPPSGFTAVYDGAKRRVTSRWVAAPGATATQIHEGEKDPTRTLKATVAAGVQERVSSELAGGRYRWAARSVGPDGAVSPLTEWIVIDVPRKGDDEPGEDPGEQPQPGGPHPSDVLDLRHWTVALDVGGVHDPDNDYRIGETHPGKFYVREDGGIVFRARAGGVTTKNSKYPRVELREMVDDDWTEAARPSSVPSSLEFEEALDARGLSARPRIVGAQIHGGGDDVCQVMLHETAGLVLMHSDGKAFEVIDADYVDGTRFTGRIVVVPRPGEDKDLIQFWYNGRLAAQIRARGSAWYFKLGAYLQTNPETWGEDPAATGEVVVWRLICVAP